MQPTTAELLQLASQHMTPTYSPPPLVAGRGQGAQLWDCDGREYLDFAGGMGVNLLGHAHPRLVQAIASQAATLCHTSNALLHRPGIDLSAALTDLSFGEQVFLCNSGTEAIEAALKLARRWFFDQGGTPRTQFVATHNSFHGRTYGALSVTGQDTYRKGFGPLVEGVHFVPFDNLPAMTAAVSRHTAAVIVEPIQGNAGVIMPSPGYLQGLRDICTATETLLILDEVQTGMGRTGKWFAHEHEGVLPDVMCLSKALGGGLPLGALVTTQALGKTFQIGVHGSTFGGNPVACAAGLALIHTIQHDGLLARAAALGEQYRAMLRQLQAKHPSIVEVRGQGMLVGIVLNGPVKTLQAACAQHGMFTTAAGAQVLRLFPPLTVEEAQLSQSVDILQRALA